MKKLGEELAHKNFFCSSLTFLGIFLFPFPILSQEKPYYSLLPYYGSRKHQEYLLHPQKPCSHFSSKKQKFAIWLNNIHLDPHFIPSLAAIQFF